MLAIRGAFLARRNGQATVAARAETVDALVTGIWNEALAESPVLREGVALLAVGGYGRSELFPYSDVDLLFLLDGKVQENEVKQPIRRMCQELWDAGIRLSPVTRRRSECERFDPANVEFALALMDHRLLAGDAAVYQRMHGDRASQAAGEGEQGHRRAVARTDGGAAPEVRRDAVPPGAEHQGLPGRAAGSACLRVAGDSLQQRARVSGLERSLRRAGSRQMRRSFSRRGSSCLWCAAFCTTGMSATTMCWTGRRRMLRPRRRSG